MHNFWTIRPSYQNWRSSSQVIHRLNNVIHKSSVTSEDPKKSKNSPEGAAANG